PSRLTVKASPEDAKNCKVPVSVVSVLLTSSTSVVQPPPSAMWVAEVAAVGDIARSATGNDVIMNSPRSLMRVRTETAAIGTLEVKVNVRASVMGLGGLAPTKGRSFRNALICEFGAIVMFASPKLDPAASVKKKETEAIWLFGFARA